MFSQDAPAVDNILHRHPVAGEGHHPAAMRAVPGIQRQFHHCYGIVIADMFSFAHK